MSGAAAAAAAAAAAKRMREEEEELSEYSDRELNDGWEFKILRSNTSAFKKPEVFRQVCQEEARAGWILVEKFDENRIRFKRPTSAKEKDRLVDFDPYRTTYGISANLMVLSILGITFGAVGFFVILGLIFG